jgi:predicted N-formylglutamate amidohydrolase
VADGRSDGERKRAQTGERAAARLLEPNEPPAFEWVNAAGTSNAVLVCDHASNRFPLRLGSLGLTRAQVEEHIAWDPGAADVARRLAAYLDAPLLLANYSRLAIDCNRPLRSAESIAEHSAGIRIPGNRGLSAEDRAARVGSLFVPYHRAIAALLDSRRGRSTLLLSVHSFTPILYGRVRPWHVGVCHALDGRLAALLLAALARGGGLTLGDNEPYSISGDTDYTIPVHGEGRGLPCAMIEIRQDGIRSATDAALWAQRLARAYRQIEPRALALGAIGQGPTPSGPGRPD